MKILIPHDPEEYVNKGSYLRRLSEAYSSCGFHVFNGSALFFDPGQRFDVVHILWPEHFRWIDRSESAASCFTLYANRLSCLAKQSTCIWTVCNLVPHRHVKSELHHWLYQETINCCSGLVHHFNSSKKLLRERYAVPSNMPEIVLPCGNYRHMATDLEKEKARAHLGLQTTETVFLFIGQLRLP